MRFDWQDLETLFWIALLIVLTLAELFLIFFVGMPWQPFLVAAVVSFIVSLAISR